MTLINSTNRNRRIRYLAAGVALVLLLFGWLVYRSTRTSVNLAAYAPNIHMGMSASEVESVLGSPMPSWAVPESMCRSYQGANSVLREIRHQSLFWFDGDTLLEVFVDESMTVMGYTTFTEHVISVPVNAASGP